MSTDVIPVLFWLMMGEESHDVNDSQKERCLLWSLRVFLLWDINADVLIFVLFSKYIYLIFVRFSQKAGTKEINEMLPDADLTLFYRCFLSFFIFIFLFQLCSIFSPFLSTQIYSSLFRSLYLDYFSSIFIYDCILQCTYVSPLHWSPSCPDVLLPAFRFYILESYYSWIRNKL